jgi:predicted phosphodiesterase
MDFLSEAHRRILFALDESDSLSYSELSDATGLTTDSIRGRVSEMISAGIPIEKQRLNGNTFLSFNHEETEMKMPVTYGDMVSSRTKSMESFININSLITKLKAYNPKSDASKKIKFSGRDIIPVLFLSDLHIGQKIVLGGNTVYDISIANERLDKLFDYTLEHLNEYGLSELVVFLGGDIVDGDSIYKNHIFHVEKAAIDQVTEATSMLSRNFKKMVSNGVSLDVHAVRGNHGIVNYKNVEVDNWDNVVYDMLDLVFDDNDNVMINHHREDYASLDWLGKRIVVMHGDYLPMQISTPSGSSAFRGLCTRFGLSAGDMLMVGHYHTFGVESDHDKILIRNGSLCDTNDYALKKNLFSSPTQTLLLVQYDSSYPTIIPMGV